MVQIRQNISLEMYTLRYGYQREIPWEKNYITATIDVTFAQSIKVFLIKFDRCDYMTEDILQTDVTVYNTNVGQVLEKSHFRKIIFKRNHFLEIKF